MLKNRRYLFGTTVLAGVLMAAAPSFAQTAQTPPAADQETELGEVIVTGSLIRRSAETAPTPLIAATQEEIQNSGELNIVDYLADLPALQASQVYEDTTGGFVGIGGLALLNLRNLGSERTLVLVDGRRHVAGSAGGNAVDVDTIPSALVERVEIITGGASALYGADAVSGVVNFILRDDFEGLEIDASVGQLTQDENALNQRLSVTYGKNFFDGRLNVYGYAEAQTSDVVNDKDLAIDWLQSDTRLVTLDADPGSAPSDGITDAGFASGLRSLNRPIGGILSLANGTRPTNPADPDIPFGSCTAAANNLGTNFLSNCFATNPGVAYQFQADGTPYLADFGLGQTFGAVNRTTTVGGSGDRLVAVETNRLPEQENYRFQTGLNFDITDNVQAFAEVKYVNEENIDVFQPHFANIGIRAFGATEQPEVDTASLTNHEISLDNAFLPASVRNAILGNVRTVYNANGDVTGTVADPRAQVRLFSYDLGYRPSIAARETTRFVGGFRGDFDNLFFLKDGSWEVGYTYGQMDAVNTEPETIDLTRYVFSIDAVRDTAGEVNGRPGEVVCRVQLLADRGVAVINPATGTAFAANDPTISSCVPGNIFGQGGLTPARDYILTSLTTEEQNKQHDVRAFVSGNLWDFWGAGPIGIALGGEYRDERTSADLTDFGPRVLFGNSGGDLAEVGYDVAEAFVELRVPLLTDVFLAEDLEISGAFRYSDYSTFGEADTYSLSAFWRPVSDFALRGTYGTSVRAPTLSNLFSPPFETFPSLTDNCSSLVIQNTADSRIRNNRIANCAALGIPTTYVDPNPSQSNTGLSGSNPNLTAEESTSHTISAIFTPRFAPDFSLVVDYYDVKIENAISTLSAQTLLNLCTDEDVLNDTACGVFTRADPDENNAYEIIDFIEGPFNFASLRSRGIDFQARYSLDIDEQFGRNWGTLDFGVNGNYLIRRQNFTNPAFPTLATDIDATANNPRVRFRTNVTWTKGGLGLTWRTDVQTSQVITRRTQVGANFDSRNFGYFTTGSFVQHDWVANYDIGERYSLRAGVTNVFDAEPNIQTGLTDNFDLFGRRYFAGITARF